MHSASPDNITALEPDEVFVFGSNTAGRHGKAAALFARQKFGARYGVGVGPTGQCYAIPTKDAQLNVLPLAEIAKHVERFLAYAGVHPERRFLVTKVGCGESGYAPSAIAPLFFAHPIPSNVWLPREFLTFGNPDQPV